MTTPKKPTDHLSNPQPFTFTDSAGKEYSLPFASVGREKMTGRDIRDATLGGEIAQLGFLIKVLEAAEPKGDALDALYDLPSTEMMEILRGWGDHGDGDGASLGK